MPVELTPAPAPAPATLRHRFGPQAIEFYTDNLTREPLPWLRKPGTMWQEQDLERIRLLRQLDDEEIATPVDGDVQLAYQRWYDLEAQDKAGLRVSRPFDFPGKLVAFGDASTAEFRLELEFRDQHRKVDLADRTGPFLHWKGQTFDFSQPLLDLVSAVEHSREVLKENRDITMRLLEIGRLVTAAQRAQIPCDPYLLKQHVISPDRVVPVASIGSTPDTLEIRPSFPGLEDDIKLTRQLDAEQTKAIYQYNREDGSSNRVILSKPIKEAVEQMRKIRRLSGSQRRRFLDSPEEFLDHPSIDLSDFGDRVIGLVTRRVRFYPQMPPSKTEWLPTVALKIEDESGLREPWDMVVGPDDVEQMLEQLRSAQQENISTFEFKGVDFPANPVVEGKLNDLLKKLGPGPGGQEQVDDAKPERLELDIKENIDSVEYREDRSELQGQAGSLELPVCLKSEVRLLSHQKDGVAWLQFLYRNKASCGALLADDMGLGKTIQLWTFLEWVRLNVANTKPSLIVCPVSLINNWEDEYHKFFAGPESVPRVGFVRLNGEETRRYQKGKGLDLEALRQFPYVLTSYETLRQYHLDLPRIDWACVVLDEAQKIKNPATQVTRAAKALKADFRIASTGTPVENHLSELWCIVDFVEPGRLGCLKDFLKEFPSDPAQAENLTKKIQLACGSLLKRRLKSQISLDLPEKSLHAPRISLSSLQQQQYAAALASWNRKDENTPPILALLQGLRRLCAFHGGAELSPDIKGLASDSAKFTWLLTTLDTIRQQREKVIIFIELREYQRLLAHFLGEHYGLSIRIINGEVSAARDAEGSRHQILKEFNDCPGFQILILSPLAAGVGLTITCANHVVHYMRHWNPAKEDQATDRAYRIGQTREVFVYQPLCIAPDYKTFDEGLHELLERKRALAENALFPALHGEVKPDEVWGSLTSTASEDQ